MRNIVIILSMDKNKSAGCAISARSIAVMLLMTVSLFGCGTQRIAKIRVPDLPPPVTKPIKHVNVALVLSSGGFRGMAHVGVIEVLQEHDVPIDLIVGSSAGSVVGALYADNPSATTLKKKLIHAKYDNLIDTSIVCALKAPFCPTGPIRGYALQNFMYTHMHARDFEDLKIPLLVVTTSIQNNKMEILQTGPIIPAVHASAALPPYFAPVNMYENTFVDGGVISPVPVAVAKQYNPKLTIAVDISQQPSMAEVQNAFQIANRAMDIKFHALAVHQSNLADIVIRPDIIGYGPFEDEYNEAFYLAGRRAALAKIPDIKAALLKTTRLE